MKKIGIVLLVLLICFFVLRSTSWKFRDYLLQIEYDLTYQNPRINSYAEVDKIFKEFEQLKYSNLDTAFISNTLSDKTKYKNLLRNLIYYNIPREKMNCFIAGNFRLKEFIGKDTYYKSCVLNEQDHVTCVFDKRIFYKTIDLQKELEAKNLNPEGFYITNGHRHPSFNEEIGGASLSRHIKGQAVDITVTDINMDGKITLSDKDLVIDILENKVIRNQGGIGLYPNTQHLHYDVRGKRARWNSF